MDHFEEEAAAVWCGRDKGTKRKTTTIIIFITYGAKLLNVDLKQRALFLITRAPFGDQEGMITWYWLAEHACIKLVSRLKRDFEKEFQNWIASEFDTNAVISS